MERSSHSIHVFSWPDGMHISLSKWFSEQGSEVDTIAPILKRGKAKLRSFRHCDQGQAVRKQICLVPQQMTPGWSRAICHMAGRRFVSLTAVEKFGLDTRKNCMIIKGRIEWANYRRFLLIILITIIGVSPSLTTWLCTIMLWCQGSSVIIINTNYVLGRHCQVRYSQKNDCFLSSQTLRSRCYSLYSHDK